MRLALVGRQGSITNWLEEAAAAWRGNGHEVRLFYVRRPWMAASLEARLAGPIGRRLSAGLQAFRPELIIAIGAYHVPPSLLAAIAGRPGRAPLVGWVGDAFEATALAEASLYDLVAYTDSALMARHREWGFAPPALFLPHAIDPHRLPAAGRFEGRAESIVFIGNPTPGRRSVIQAVSAPLALYGPGWRRDEAAEVHAGRLPARRVMGVLAGHRFALNIRNELNVLAGLNQRNFQPCAAGAALITDDQPDLIACFEPGAEVLVWRQPEEIKGHHGRLTREPAFAAAVAERGRARVLAHHTYAHRLASLTAALGSS